ncbi:MAG: class I adenylate-forming enzyme family protein [Sedimentisphaerales bacterium]|nr:class I adenylate-forming enzyme family protein [Sedimentisphaerales bacterium]
MQTELEYRNLIELFNGSLSEITSLDKECLEIIRPERREVITFGQLQTRARDFALWLVQDRGIDINDKIAVLGKNRVDWDVALWGIILAGAVPVLIDPERPVEGVKTHLMNTDARLVVMADDYQDEDSQWELKEWANDRGVCLIEMTVFEKVRKDEAKADELLSDICRKKNSEETAAILCTSGTTGDPREVELTHTNFIANIQGSVEKIRLTHEDTLGHILPPHHSFGLTVGKLLPFWVGANNVYTNQYRHVSELIRDKGVTIFIAVPALFTVLAKKFEENLTKLKRKNPLVRLLDRCLPKVVGKRIIRKLGWDRLRFFLSGSAPMPNWVLDVFWRRGILHYEGYGTTENSPVYGFNESVDAIGSVGQPITTMLVKIINEEGDSLRPGEKGEIALGGPCIMKGYYKNPKATQVVVSTDDKGVRWLHTGDLGYLDEDGNLYITGRKKYLIVLPGGKNVNPETVESALSQAHYVHEILVVPDIRKDSIGIEQETVRAIIRPDWDVIEANTSFSYDDLVKQPKVLRSLVWQSVHECQMKSRRLSSYEKVASNNLEIRMEEFHKTSTGKIKREVYMKL